MSRELRCPDRRFVESQVASTIQNETSCNLITSLPNELLNKICDYLSPIDSFSFGLTHMILYTSHISVHKNPITQLELETCHYCGTDKLQPKCIPKLVVLKQAFNAQTYEKRMRSFILDGQIGSYHDRYFFGKGARILKVWKEARIQELQARAMDNGEERCSEDKEVSKVVSWDRMDEGQAWSCVRTGSTSLKFVLRRA